MPLVFRHGAAETAFVVASASWLLFEFATRVRQRVLARGTTSADPTFFILVPCIIGSFVAAEILSRHGGLIWPGGLLWPVVTGLTLMVAGLVVRAWAILVLGRLFQVQIRIQPGHQVVTAGPYRYVRHPSYTGLALILAGLALACGDVWSLVVVAAVAAAGLVVRIRAEERQLTEALGTEYEEFAATRKRLIPGVW